MFDFTGVGASVAVFGIVYLAIASKYLLRKTPRATTDGDAISEFGPVSVQHRQYVVSFRVLAGSAIVGHSVTKSGITTAKDVTFIAVRRGRAVLPFDDDLVLLANDEYVTADSDRVPADSERVTADSERVNAACNGVV